MLNMSIGIMESLDNIFSAVVVGGISRDNTNFVDKQAVFKHSMPKFMARFGDNIFENEYAFFYEVIKSLKIKVFSEDQLRTIVMSNAARILESPYIQTSKWQEIMQDKLYTNEEKIEFFLQFVSEKMVYLSNKVVTEEIFDSSCEVYIEFYKEELMTQTINNMALIMTDTGFEEIQTKGRRKHYRGSTDAQKYYNEKLRVIRALDSENQIRSTVIDGNWYEAEVKKDSQGDQNALLDFGIDELDETVGEMRRGNVIGILGPPKGGKTRMTNYLVERALEKGLNVAVWPLEGTQDEWTSMQTALIVRKFKENPMKLNSKNILQSRYKDEYEHQNIMAAKKIMASDTTRGKLSFIKGTAYVEDFLDVLQGHYDNENQFDIIVVDQLINVISKTGRGRADRVSEAYLKLKDFVANQLVIPALALLPTQMKQDVVDKLRNKPDETIDVTAGGESAETIRTPDEVIGLFSDKKERSSGQMKIYSVASRHSGNFDDFYVGCELGCCYFFSKPELNM